MEQRKTYRFLDPGSPLISIYPIRVNHQKIKVTNIDKLPADIPTNSYARVHSHAGAAINVWVCDGNSFTTLILAVPQELMGQYFRQHPHGMFQHFA